MTKGVIENPFDYNTKPYEEWEDLTKYVNPSGSLIGKGGKYLRVKSDETGTEWASGGGSGTDDYNELNNKPKINNVELIGNITLETINAVKRSGYSSSDYGKVIKIDTDGIAKPMEITVPSATWGNINGKITSQTDLMNELAKKISFDSDSKSKFNFGEDDNGLYYVKTT